MGERGPKGGWTDERAEALKKLWADGKSASEIARALGGGLSRNAVIGKVHRMGMSSAGRSHQTRSPVSLGRTKATGGPRSNLPPRFHKLTTTATGPAVAPPPAEAAIEPIPDNVIPVAFDDLPRNGCRWPIGDPRDPAFGYCGEPAVDTLPSARRPPYCAHHQGGHGRGFAKGDLSKQVDRLTRHDGIIRRPAAASAR